VRIYKIRPRIPTAMSGLWLKAQSNGERGTAAPCHLYEGSGLNEFDKKRDSRAKAKTQDKCDSREGSILDHERIFKDSEKKVGRNSGGLTR
jgi:hypothetical protein